MRYFLAKSLRRSSWLDETSSMGVRYFRDYLDSGVVNALKEGRERVASCSRWGVEKRTRCGDL